MKRKNIYLVCAAALLILITVGAWIWYNNYLTTNKSLIDVKKSGVLLVGSGMPYGVMEFFDQNNQPVGFDVDISQEIATRLGVKLEFKDYDWNQLFVKLKSGEINLAVSSITITPERQKEMLFSDPYFNGGQVIIVNIDNQEVVGVNSLVGKKIAVQEGTTGYDEAKKYTSDNLISTYLNFNNSDTGPNIIKDLKNQKFDAIIVDYIQALDLIKNNQGLKIVGVPFTRETYGVATKLGNDALIKKINSIFRDMKNDGTFDKINKKWIKY
jgi:ABC-type amino acid transport substrate-binding protein